MSHDDLPNDLYEVMRDVFRQRLLIAASLSGPRLRQPESLLRIEVKPVLLRGEHRYQFAYHRERKVTHRNLSAEEAAGELARLLTEQFKRAVLQTTEGEIQATLNKRRESAIRCTPVPPPTSEKIGQPSAAIPLNLRHDRKKNHLLQEDQPIPFLVRLGVMSAEGKVIAARRDKFRQINRFLEMVADVMEPLLERAGRNPDQALRIVDFGCGKAYLTFALYHYLHEMRGLKVRMVGVDLKQEVIAQCSAIAADLGYGSLAFVVGSIQDTDLGVVMPFFQTAGEQAQNDGEGVEMVVALHACDTATDDALVRAVAWNAQVILAAPCCQHELMHQIHNDTLAPLLRHGIIRERLASLLTDTLRAELLAQQGYHVQILEFIDAEHTPKNLLIRAVKQGDVLLPARSKALQQEYTRLRDFWHVQPYMEQAMEAALSKLPPRTDADPVPRPEDTF